ncbi:M1 family metallopeptidase [Abyssibacter sp.]|uniref:M1 family metallopeptidase n=1 Tax=Abyssibacter sp. TaxID=2320200 RepID=UPI0025C50196|nr:M1 family metallopeptidase [Abyssibacter sp.]MCK5860615.1 M1 family metallopeptidase [Abyssibacter sp.]
MIGGWTGNILAFDSGAAVAGWAQEELAMTLDVSRLSRALMVCACTLSLTGCGGSDAPEPHSSPADAAQWVAPSTETPVREQAIPRGRLGDAVVPTAYALNLNIDPDADRFSGRVIIDVRIAEPVDVIYLHGKNLTVSAATLSAGETLIAAEYAQVDPSGVARLSLPISVSAGQARLTIDYGAPFSTTLDGLYKVEEDDRAYAFTQFEAISARMAFPSFDEPRFKVPFDLAVSAKADHSVISATPVRRTETAVGGAVRHVFEQTPPLPTYLIAFAVGPLDINDAGALPPNAIRHEPLPFRGAAAYGKGARLAYALESTRPLLEGLETYFGTPHPYPKLDIIAAPDFAFGAMENVGAIIYREQRLLLDENASLKQRQAFVYTHAHELAHQWFGNLVTPLWWDDIWLNEAFATWLAYKVSDQWNPSLQFSLRLQRLALETMATDALASTRQIRQPVESNDDIINAFDGITYRKGGAVLSMFERFVGETAFREGVRLHMDRHANGVATAEDFMQSIADGSEDERVVPAFRSFLEQPGVPLVSASVQCDGVPTLTLAQQRYRPLGSAVPEGGDWQIPVCFVALDGEQAEETCHLLTKPRETLELQQCPQALLPNAAGAGYYRWTLPSDGWAALLDRIDRLSPPEQLSLIDNLDAAFRAGELEFSVLRDALPVLAEQPNWEVATRLAKAWAQYQNSLVDEAGHAAMRSALRTAYAPRFEQELGLQPDPKESNNDALLRGRLAEILVRDAADSETLARLAEAADAYIGPQGGAMQPGALPGDVIEPALIAGVIERGPAFADRLWARFETSTDAILREHILTAVATAPQPEIAAEARRRALTDDLRSNELLQVLRDQFAASVTRPDAWEWLRQHADAVLARLPETSHGRIAKYPEQFCSPERRAEITAFLEPRVESLFGGPRTLDQTLEKVDLCIALKQARGEQVAQAMAATEPVPAP